MGKVEQKIKRDWKLQNQKIKGAESDDEGDDEGVDGVEGCENYVGWDGS